MEAIDITTSEAAMACIVGCGVVLAIGLCRLAAIKAWAWLCSVDGWKERFDE